MAIGQEAIHATRLLKIITMLFRRSRRNNAAEVCIYIATEVEKTLSN